MNSDAYFAGLFDGEGGFYLEKKGRQPGIRPLVQISMTCEKTIRAVMSHFKVGTVRPQKKRGTNKRLWRWKASYNGAREVARKMLPYLITKKHEARRLLNHKPFVRKRSSLKDPSRGLEASS